MNHDQMNHMNHSMTSGSGFDTFVQLWGPEIMLIAVLLAALYLAVVGPYRNRFADSAPVPRHKKIAFMAGLFMFYLALGSPVAYYGHHFLFSVHMAQQCLLFIFMVPLMIMGTPAWLVQPLFNQKILGAVLTKLTNPFLGIMFFNMLFSFYHIPQIFDAFHAMPAWNIAFHVLLTLLAFQMWWPILTPIPSQQRLSELRKMAYIFINGLLLTPACALITFAGTPLFETYMNAPQLFEYHSVLEDQVLGGVLMKLMQEASYGSILAYTFFRWYRKEREKDAPLDVLPNQQMTILPRPVGDGNGGTA
ncbi:UNVERIFIED_CONTAM: putative membrane protein [Brevibacillus sp. OAP136]